jgi:hypothetical protein
LKNTETCNYFNPHGERNFKKPWKVEFFSLDEKCVWKRSITVLKKSMHHYSGHSWDHVSPAHGRKPWKRDPLSQWFIPKSSSPRVTKFILACYKPVTLPFIKLSQFTGNRLRGIKK